MGVRTQGGNSAPDYVPPVCHDDDDFPGPHELDLSRRLVLKGFKGLGLGFRVSLHGPQ